MRSLVLSVSIIPFLLTGCVKNTKPLFAKDLSTVNERNNSLFVFVGEKIELKTLPPNSDSWGGEFQATYKVLQRVYGHYAADTISFLVYDHYGVPAFDKFKNAMLFVSEDEGKFYHEKYQFFDVYKTTSGQWASPYRAGEYQSDSKIKPEKIDFENEVYYEVDTANIPSSDIYRLYPSPFYEFTGSRALAIYGNNVPELFNLKKNGVLRARHLFGNDTTELVLEGEDTPIAEWQEGDFVPPRDTSSKFLSFWNSFLPFIIRRDDEKIKSMRSRYFVNSSASTRRSQKDNEHDFFASLDIASDPATVIRLTPAANDRHEVIISNSMKGVEISLYFVETLNGYKMSECSISSNFRKKK